MKDRRRTIVAGLGLLAAAFALQNTSPLVTIEADVADRSPVTAQTAVDLGMLGTVVLSWTFKSLR